MNHFARDQHAGEGLPDEGIDRFLCDDDGFVTVGFRLPGLVHSVASNVCKCDPIRRDNKSGVNRGEGFPTLVGVTQVPQGGVPPDVNRW